MGGEGLITFLIKGKKINIRVQGLWNLAIESCNHGWKVWSKWNVHYDKKENSYQSNAILDECSKSGDGIEATTKLLNIVVIFQLVPTSNPTTFECPFSPTFQITM
jgi:hypothetical protein